MKDSIKWLGHAAFEIQTSGFTLLLDPFLTGNPLAAIRAEQAEAQYILVTHGHGDHLGDTISIAKRTGATVICNSEISGWLSAKGVKTHGMHVGGGFHFPFGYLKLTHADHGSALPDGANGGNPCGFLLTTVDGKKLYFAGDTGLFGDMELIGDEGIDLAALPIGDNFTMGPVDSVRAVQLLHPNIVIPIHYNTFDLIKQDPADWEETVKAQTFAKVAVLKPGESLEI